jgi:iron uptake system EfeUOB component EfeO/EfeM
MSHSSSETAASSKDSQDKDVDYMTSLGLMKGHLLVAKELLDAKKPKQAEPHTGHPVEELYGNIEAELSERQVPEFKTTLNQLHDLVKTAPNDSKVATSYQAATEAIDRAMRAIPEAKRQSPQFVLAVIDELLATATEEYQEAIAAGKIAELVEYQDSRGFVTYADSLYQTIAQPLNQQSPEISKTLSSTLSQLKKAWPSVEAPPSPVMTPEQVSQLVTQIKER